MQKPGCMNNHPCARQGILGLPPPTVYYTGGGRINTTRATKPMEKQEDPHTPTRPDTVRSNSGRQLWTGFSSNTFLATNTKYSQMRPRRGGPAVNCVGA